MHYMGGKTSIAKDIAEILNAEINRLQGAPFVSLFCGALSIESRIRGAKKIILNDLNPYLVSLLKGGQDGTFEIPDTVTEEQWKYIKEHNEEHPPALVGFVGFGCSYGGRWFTSFAKCKKLQNYAEEAKRSLEKKIQNLDGGAQFLCLDYREVPLPDEPCVIYCDPPYEGTTPYKGLPKFNHAQFWKYMRELSDMGHSVFISCEQAPADFMSVLEKQKLREIDKSHQNTFYVTEKLVKYDLKGQ